MFNYMFLTVCGVGQSRPVVTLYGTLSATLSADRFTLGRFLLFYWLLWIGGSVSQGIKGEIDLDLYTRYQSEGR